MELLLKERLPIAQGIASTFTPQRGQFTRRRAYTQNTAKPHSGTYSYQRAWAWSYVAPGSPHSEHRPRLPRRPRTSTCKHGRPARDDHRTCSYTKPL